jgi:cell division protein FtsW (lipid II flippase)
MKEPAPTPRFEPRWSVALTILAVILLLALLPQSIRLGPTWVAYVFGIIVLVPIAAVGLTSGQAPWLRVERTVTLLFFVVAAILILANLVNLVHAMVNKSDQITGV